MIQASIEARTQSDLVDKILKHINYIFGTLPLPEHPPPSFHPDPDGLRMTATSRDAYCF